MNQFFEVEALRQAAVDALARGFAAEQAKIAAEQALIAQQQAVLAKQEELAAHRAMLVLKHGEDLVTNHICPSCHGGYLVVRIESQQIPFLGCSRYNFYRSSCKYTCSIAPESLAELVPIFQARLAATAKGAIS
jgi:hypothetical protein